MDKQTVCVTTYPKHREKLDFFFSYYPNQLVYIPPSPPLRGRLLRKDRVCRFCGKNAGDVKFNHEPHIIPRLLGHNYGVSDFECDTCNLHFGTLENHFADYLGLARTVTSVGKDKVPKFISPLESLIAGKTSNGANKDFITISDESRDNFVFDAEKSAWQIKYTKNPHTPLNVYKCLLKIALGVLPDYEMENYQAIREFILNGKHTPYFQRFARVLQLTTQFSTELPYCIIFQKKNLKDSVPMHMMYLAFGNVSYQLCLPFHKLDGFVDYVGQVELAYAPPLVFSDISVDAEFDYQELDLSCADQMKGQKGFVTFKADPKLFTDAYDTKTKQFVNKPFDPSQITKVFLSKHDGAIDFDDLNT